MTGGVVVGGRYRLDEIIAEGGMGTVWRAHDELLDRMVAVKLLRGALASDGVTAERFRREARAAGSLSHPNMANIFDYVDDGDVPGIVMELVDGETLAERISRDAPMGVQEAVGISSAVLQALDAAHRIGLIHRDVKPANVMITTDGHVKVTDFGIARAAGESTLTQTGTVLGSVHYVSPEQVRGEPPAPAADIYAVAVMLYEMLTGRRPFEGESPVAVAMSRLTKDPVHPRRLRADLPPGLDAAVIRGLARDPAARYDSALGMISALESAVASADTAPIRPPARAMERTMVLPLAPDDDSGRTVVLHPDGPAGSAPSTERVRRKMRILTPLWALLTVGLLALLVLAFCNRQPATVEVPNFVDLSLERAKAEAARAGLEIGRVDRQASAKTAGTVLAQSVAAGQTVRRDSSIVVAVSTGVPPCCKVPSLRGMTKEAAEQSLTRNGLVLGEITSEETEDFPHQTVIGQSLNPGATAPRGSKVAIVLADNEDRRGKGKGPGR